MRSPLRFVGIVLLLALGGGCDTTQPLQIGTETYQLEFTGLSSNRVPFYNVYYMVEDGVPDQVYLFCKTASPANYNPVSIPLNFSVTVEILRAGETVPEVVVSSLDLDDNLTQYDTRVFEGQPASQNPITIDDGGQLRTFRFDNPPPRRLAVAADEVMQATTNPLYELAPGTYGLGNGLCSTNYPGQAGIEGMPMPISLEINKGDTVIVQARKSDLLPLGSWYLSAEPRLEAELLLNGQTVQVRGNTVSEPEPGAGLSFSFTAL